MKDLRSHFVVIIILCFFTNACSDQKTGVSLRLTHAERVRIDSIYTSRLDSLRPIWDSLCEAGYDSSLKVALDSIVSERLEEEDRLRSRVSN
jgi:hypothetical protein